MLSAHQEIERLLEQILAVAGHNPAVEKASGQISALCEACLGSDPLAGFPPGLDHHHFSPGETEVLKLLYRRRGATCSKWALMAIVPRQDDTHEPDDKGADVRICRIRKRLKGTPYEIETVWGRGYRMKPIAEGKH